MNQDTYHTYYTREFDIRTGLDMQYQVHLHPGQAIEDIIVEIAEAQLPPEHSEYDAKHSSLFVLVRASSEWEIGTMRNMDTNDEEMRGLHLFIEGEERYVTFVETGEDVVHFSLQEAQDRLHEIAQTPERYPALFP